MNGQTLRAAACLAALMSVRSLATAQAIPPPAPATSPLAAQIAARVAQPAVAHDHWGIMVTTLDGTPLYGLNEAQLFQPDSNAKLFTTAAALALLGPTRTFQTKVIAEGTIAPGGVLHGDLILRGGGDANFASSRFPYLPPSQRPAKDATTPPSPLAAIDELADQVVAKGVKEIDGDVIGDDSYFAYDPYPQGWSHDDLLWGYGAPVSALTIHANQIDVTIAPGAATKDGEFAEIRLSPDLPYYTGERRVYKRADFGDDSVLFERAPGSKELSITGHVATKPGPVHEEVAIKVPAEYAALALKTALEKRGVQVKGGVNTDHWDPGDSAPFLSKSQAPIPLYAPELRNVPASSALHKFSDLGYFINSENAQCSYTVLGGGPQKVRTELATHISPPVAEDVKLTNKLSQNLHAEMMIRNIANTKECMPEAANGVQWVRHFLMYASIDPLLRWLGPQQLRPRHPARHRQAALLRGPRSQDRRAPALVRRLEGLAAHRRRGRHTLRPLHQTSAQRPRLRQDRDP